MVTRSFPPVSLDSVEPWGHPQALGGGSPGNFAPVPAFGSPARVPTATMPASPGDRSASAVRDPHHYASVISLATAVANGVSAKFLDAPTNKRNYLAFRNNSAVANIYIEFNKAATTRSVIRLTPNTMVLFDTVVPQDDVYAIADAAPADLAYSYSTVL